MVAGLGIILGIRPEHCDLAWERAGMMRLNVDHVEILGADTLVYGHFGEDNARLTVRLPALHRLKKNTILLNTSANDFEPYETNNLQTTTDNCTQGVPGEVS
jgi:ABC-type sugar transport system ATPase subunit